MHYDWTGIATRHPVATDPRSSRTRRPLLIDFLGIHGSGKTTLCSAIVSELRQEGFVIATDDDYAAWLQQSFYKKLCYIALGGLKVWRITVHSLYFLRSLTSLRGCSLLKSGYEITCMQIWLSRVSACPRYSVVMLHSFICHNLSITLRNSPLLDRAGPKLANLLFLFYHGCNVHWVLKNVTPELAAQRISRRPVLCAPTLLESLSPAQRESLLRQQALLFQEIFRSIQSRCGKHAYDVDGAVPIEAQVEFTKKLVVYLLNRRNVVDVKRACGLHREIIKH